MSKTSLQPNEAHASLREINFRALLPRRHVIVDIDNTLLPFREVDLDPSTISFLRDLKDEGVIEAICLVSNNTFPSKRRRQKIAALAKQLDASYLFAMGWYSKPHPRPFRKAMQLMNATPETTIVIGDQIFTDIRGGNRLGAYTILVKPLGKDAWFTKYRRWRERRLERGT